jgi:hypothetical protein
VENPLLLLPPLQLGLEKPTRFFVLSGRGSVYPHHFRDTFQPFFRRYRELLSSRFPRGVELVPLTKDAQDVHPDDFFVWWQPKESERGIVDATLSRFRRERTAIVHYENPVSYSFRRWVIREGYHSRFGKVFCSAAILADGVHTFWIPIWNYLIHFESERPVQPLLLNKPEKVRLLAINPIRTGIDVSRRRIEIVDGFMEAFDECDMFAAQDVLDHPIIKRWRHRLAGEIEFAPDNYRYLKKIEVFQGYRFVLVVENTFSDWYISEKLAEPLAALCVPIYFGNPSVTRYMPNLFGAGVINGHDFADLDQLLDYVRAISDVEYCKRLARIREARDEYFNLTSYRTICDYVLAKVCGVEEIATPTIYQHWNDTFALHNCTGTGQQEKEVLLRLIADADDAAFTSEVPMLLMSLCASRVC